MSEETLGEGLTSDQLASNRERIEAERKLWREDPEGMEMALRHRCFMDGAKKTCLTGGCGVVEVEVRLIRWVEKQDLKYEALPLSNGERRGD